MSFVGYVQKNIQQKKVNIGLFESIEKEKLKGEILKQIEQINEIQKKLEQEAKKLRENVKDLVKNNEIEKARQFCRQIQFINQRIEKELLHKKFLKEYLIQVQNANTNDEISKMQEQIKKHYQQCEQKSQNLIDLIQQVNKKKRQQQMIQKIIKELESNQSKQKDQKMTAQLIGDIIQQRKQTQGVYIDNPEQKKTQLQQQIKFTK